MATANPFTILDDDNETSNEPTPNPNEETTINNAFTTNSTPPTIPVSYHDSIPTSQATTTPHISTTHTQLTTSN